MPYLVACIAIAVANGTVALELALYSLQHIGRHQRLNHSLLVFPAYLYPESFSSYFPLMT
jgi:hypothetical protein